MSAQSKTQPAASASTPAASPPADPHLAAVGQSGPALKKSAPPAAGSPANGAKKTPPAPRPKGIMLELPLSLISASKLNPRREFNEAALQELAESIKAEGVLQPIVARKGARGYEIVIGERRWRAAQMAKVEKIPVVTYEDISDAEALAMAMTENLQRQDMNPMEEAEGFVRLMELRKKENPAYTQDELAVEMGKSRPAVSNAIRLTGLPPEVQKMIRERKPCGQHVFTSAHGVAILRFKDSSACMSYIAKYAIENGLSAGDLEEEHQWDILNVLKNEKLAYTPDNDPWARDQPWQQRAKDNPTKFLKWDGTIVCLDWNLGKKMAADWRQAKREKEAAKGGAQKKPADKEKETGIDLNDYRASEKWAKIGMLPEDLLEKIPADAIKKARPNYGEGNKLVEVAPAALVKPLLEQYAERKREQAEARHLAAVKIITPILRNSTDRIDDKSAAILAATVLARMGTSTIEEAAAQYGVAAGKSITRAKAFTYGGRPTDVENVLKELESLGAVKCLRLALGAILENEKDTRGQLDTLPVVLAYFTAPKAARKKGKK